MASIHPPRFDPGFGVYVHWPFCLSKCPYCDFNYARPGQSPQAWRRELSEALTRGTEHVSLYQLTIEPDTIFERLRDTGKLDLPDADTSRALWDTTQEVMNMAGMPAYEISNHAKP